uniref:Uncharacterized protein n=1 Tax=uncultured prokaryote TaxID=198431 RepID=A0A0H5PVQ2_9ZZZZ|nr:hypothetical protein [uncultured prokaryote]
MRTTKEAAPLSCMPRPQQRHGTSGPEPRPARAFGRRGPDTDRPRKGPAAGPVPPLNPGGVRGREGSRGEAKRQKEKPPGRFRVQVAFLPCAGLTLFPAVPHRPRDHMIARRSRCVNPQTAGGRRRRPRARPAGRARRPRRGAERGTSGAGGARSRPRPGARTTRGGGGGKGNRQGARRPPETARGERRARPRPGTHRRGREAPAARQPAKPALSRDAGADGGPRRPQRSGRGVPSRRSGECTTEARGAGIRADAGRAAPSSAGRQPARPRDCRAYRLCALAQRGGGPPGRGPGPRPARQPSGWLRSGGVSLRGASRSVAQRRGALASVSEPLRASRSVASIAERRAASRSIGERQRASKRSVGVSRRGAFRGPYRLPSILDIRTVFRQGLRSGALAKDWPASQIPGPDQALSGRVPRDHGRRAAHFPPARVGTVP